MRESFELAWNLLPLQLWNTIYMVVVAAAIAVLLGFPIGVVLTLTSKGGLKEHRTSYRLLSGIVNIGRSFPFAILMIALIPFTRLITGTSLGTNAAIVPLAIAAAPFMARIVENSLRSVDRSLIEAAKVMGSSHSQIVCKVLTPEAAPFLVSGTTLMIVSLIGYSAMAGLVGGGGLGQVAIQYGYNRFNGFIMISTVVLLIVLVQFVEMIGAKFARLIQKKRGVISHEN